MISQAQKEALGRVAVVMGGYSAEREISLVSGKSVYEALQSAGVDVVAITVDDDLIRPILAEAPDRVFIALHGRGGEDGVLQGALQAAGIPYTGSGVLGSAIAMDKVKTRNLWAAAKLPVAPGWVIDAPEHVDEEKARLILARLGPKVAVKPANEGSSVGVSCAENVETLLTAIREAARYDQNILIEHWIDGDEYTVGILNMQALPSIRIETPEGFYDYQAKYQSNSTQYHCPSGLSDEEEAKLGDIALRAFRCIGCSGWGRVDLIRDRVGRWFLLEANTVPGMTPKSLVPMAAKQTGLSFEALCVQVILSTLE